MVFKKFFSKEKKAARRSNSVFKELEQKYLEMKEFATIENKKQVLDEYMSTLNSLGGAREVKSLDELLAKYPVEQCVSPAVIRKRN